MGARHKVGKVDYYSGHQVYRYKDYELYVTDSTSNNMTDWGAPVACGTFENNPTQSLITCEINPIPKTGQYVILHALSVAWDQAGASEIAIYGIDTGIDRFELSDQITGNTWYSDDNEVNVLFTALLPDGVTAEGWLVLEPHEPPPDFDDPGFVWPALPPTSIELTQPEGLVGLYGWMLDSTGTVHETSATII